MTQNREKVKKKLPHPNSIPGHPILKYIDVSVLILVDVSAHGQHLPKIILGSRDLLTERSESVHPGHSFEWIY
jgi:hypothetical protein